MALTTRCPQCGTAFKVVPDQLKIRDGLVRCGVCASVFDGRATLVAEIPTLHAEPSLPVPPPPPVPPPAIEVVRTRVPVASAEPEVLRGRHHALRRAEPVMRDDDEAHDAPAGDWPADSALDTELAAPAGLDAYAVQGEARMRYVDNYHTGRAPPEFLDEGHARQRAHRGRLWGWACLAAAIALVGLSAYVYRVQWATQVPALRPLLQGLCAPLQCAVGYERRIERISILSSSLRPPPGGASAQGEQDLVLTAVLRNRFNAPQHWPALTLELKDFSDTVMVRKTLLPRDYLPADVLAQPFGPNAERKIVLPLRVHDVQVNGYQLDRFFP